MIENAITKIVKQFDLTSASSIAKDGGTITGSPTFSCDGASLNGTADKIDFTGVVYGIKSFIFKFRVGSTTEQIMTLTSSHNIHVSAGTLTATGFSSPTIYLNGVATATVAANTWYTCMITTATGIDVDALSIGYINPDYGDVEIDALLLSNEVKTAAEALDLYDNSTFNFQNMADVYLDFKANYGNLVKDRSGNGKDFTTVNTIFKNPGEELNGSTAYMLNSSASGIYNNTYQTIVMCFKPDFNWDEDSNIYLFDSDNRYYLIKLQNSSNNALQILFANVAINNIAASAYTPYWRQHGTNVLIITGTSGDTDTYFNGKKIDSSASNWTPSDASTLTLGGRFTSSSYFDGEIFHFSTYGNKFAQKMTPTQVRALTSQLLNTYSK